MKKMTMRDTAEYLLTHDNYCILTHRRPDGDTIGSAAALCRLLRRQGKTAHILRNREITPRFAWLHEGLTVEAPGEEDILISVDVASPNMLGEQFAQYQDRIALRIDHHSAATSFTEMELVDSDAAACAELIFDLIQTLWQDPDPEMADALYVGTSTDTGCFRFSNTTAHSFLTAAFCAQNGARVYELNQQLFETNTLGRLKIQSWILEHMEFFRDGTMALVAIPASVEAEIGVTEDDMDNISNFPRSIDGVRMAATLREEGNGLVKLSVRAMPGFDATAVAVKFGGGGHKGAAGASFRCSLAEAAEKVKQAMEKLG